MPYCQKNVRTKFKLFFQEVELEGLFITLLSNILLINEENQITCRTSI
jgi:hypothetical protein